MTVTEPGQRKQSIALIGLRGCGKSVVGRELAKLLGGVCIDTDDLVVQQGGRSITDIFESEGESGFRRREGEAVRQVVADPPAVISVGGGAILDEHNVQALAQVATIVWLTAPADVLWQRIASDAAKSSSRPPLTKQTGRAEIEHLLTRRAPLYRRAADMVIDTTEITPSEAAHAIATRLNRIPKRAGR